MDKEPLWHLNHHQELTTTLKEIRDVFEAITAEVAIVNELIGKLEKTLASNLTIGYTPEDIAHFFQTAAGRSKAIRKWLHFFDEASLGFTSEFTSEESGIELF